MTSSKSSQTTRNVVIALLALWSLVSLIIIVVWATSPDLKGASQCREELHSLKSKFDEERLVWAKDRRALESLVWDGRVNQTQLMTRINRLKDQLTNLNHSLDLCQQENALLNTNITWLETEIELHKAVEANLTAEISQQQDLIENLQLNLTQTVSELESCSELNKAAKLLQTAAEKQKEACQSRKQYIEKQLLKCQKETQAQQHPHTGSSNDGAPGPGSGTALLMILSISLLLIPL